MPMATVPCPKCGHSLDVDTDFPSNGIRCPSCGATGTVAQLLAAPRAAYAQPPAPKRRFSTAFVVALVVLLPILAAVVFVMFWRPSPSPNAPPRSASEVLSRTEVLVDRAQTVSDDQFWGIQFSLSRAAVVELSIEARGNGRIAAWLVDQEDYEGLLRAQNAIFPRRYHHYPVFHVERGNQHAARSRLGPGRYALVLKEASRPNLLRRADSAVAHVRLTATP